MYFSREINFVINVSVWVYLIYFNRIKVTLPADRRTMAIGGDSRLAAERSPGMLNNNRVIHHGTRRVGGPRSPVPGRSSEEQLATVRDGEVKKENVFFSPHRPHTACITLPLCAQHRQSWDYSEVIQLLITTEILNSPFLSNRRRFHLFKCGEDKTFSTLFFLN